MDFTSLIFYLFAFIILGSGILMVRSTNLVHSALYMVVTFLGVSGIYLMLNADFLAAVQIIVYVGSISIMMVFGIMLTRRGDICESNPPNKLRVYAGLLCAVLLAIVVRFVLLTNFRLSGVVNTQSTVPQISNLFLNDYLIPFEAAALLLLVALVGAIVIGKGMRRSE